PTGHIELAATPEHATELQHRLERLVQLGYEAAGISSSTANELVPDLIVPEDCSAAVYFPHEAHCYPTLYIRHQLQRAKQLGVRLRIGANVESFEEMTDGVNVSLSDGSS
ncbi:FAD-dependent oxidoreductase, partial [Arthrobacter sp. AL08]